MALLPLARTSTRRPGAVTGTLGCGRCRHSEETLNRGPDSEVIKDPRGLIVKSRGIPPGALAETDQPGSFNLAP